MNLKEIQQQLKAPKNKFNSFGNYAYRNCEGILEAVKPMLGESKLLLSDKINQIGERYYVEATAKFIDGEGVTDEVTASARESETKKGMDDSQITGTASSYARKYALNGLFLIDDTKDADSDEFHKTTNKKPTKEDEAIELEIEKQRAEIISDVMANRITNILKLDKSETEAMTLGRELCKTFGVKKVADITNDKYKDVLDWLEGK